MPLPRTVRSAAALAGALALAGCATTAPGATVPPTAAAPETAPTTGGFQPAPAGPPDDRLIVAAERNGLEALMQGEPFDLGGGMAVAGVPEGATGGPCLERTEDVWLVNSDL